MSAAANSLLSHRLRKLANSGADAQQMEQVIRQLLECERNLHTPDSGHTFENVVGLPVRAPLRLAAES